MPSGRKPALHKGLYGQEQGAPGHFVSDEMRTDCERFIEDVKRRLARRQAAEAPRLGPPPEDYSKG